MDRYSRYAPRFQHSLAILSRIDQHGHSPRSLARTFSRSRSYSRSIQYDVNSFRLYFPSQVRYKQFFNRPRYPAYTPRQPALLPVTRRGGLSVLYSTLSLFGWSNSDTFRFGRARIHHTRWRKGKRKPRGLKVFARSYGSARFSFYYRLKRLYRHRRRAYRIIRRRQRGRFKKFRIRSTRRLRDSTQKRKLRRRYRHLQLRARLNFFTYTSYNASTRPPYKFLPRSRGGLSRLLSLAKVYLPKVPAYNGGVNPYTHLRRRVVLIKQALAQLRRAQRRLLVRLLSFKPSRSGVPRSLYRSAAKGFGAPHWGGVHSLRRAIAGWRRLRARVRTGARIRRSRLSGRRAARSKLRAISRFFWVDRFGRKVKKAYRNAKRRRARKVRLAAEAKAKGKKRKGRGKGKGKNSRAKNTPEVKPEKQPPDTASPLPRMNRNTFRNYKRNERRKASRATGQPFVGAWPGKPKKAAPLIWVSPHSQKRSYCTSSRVRSTRRAWRRPRFRRSLRKPVGKGTGWAVRALLSSPRLCRAYAALRRRVLVLRRALRRIRRQLRTLRFRKRRRQRRPLSKPKPTVITRRFVFSRFKRRGRPFSATYRTKVRLARSKSFSKRDWDSFLPPRILNGSVYSYYFHRPLGRGRRSPARLPRAKRSSWRSWPYTWRDFPRHDSLRWPSRPKGSYRRALRYKRRRLRRRWRKSRRRRHPARRLLNRLYPFVKGLRFSVWQAAALKALNRQYRFTTRVKFTKKLFQKLRRYRAFSRFLHTSLRARRRFAYSSYSKSPVTGYFARFTSAIWLRNFTTTISRFVELAGARLVRLGYVSLGRLPKARRFARFFVLPVYRVVMLPFTMLAWARHYRFNSLAVVPSILTTKQGLRRSVLLGGYAWVAALQNRVFRRLLKFLFFRVLGRFKRFLGNLPTKLLASPLGRRPVVRWLYHSIARLAYRKRQGSRFLLPVLFSLRRRISVSRIPSANLFNFTLYDHSYLHYNAGRFKRPRNKRRGRFRAR
jgi:hypothetical protein